MSETASEIDGLTPGQTVALCALMDGDTIAAAAQCAKVSPRTLQRWRSEPKWQAAERGAKARALSLAGMHLATMTGRAVGVISEVMDKGTNKDLARLRAAESVLVWSLRFSETTDILHRLEALEREQ